MGNVKAFTFNIFNPPKFDKTTFKIVPRLFISKAKALHNDLRSWVIRTIRIRVCKFNSTEPRPFPKYPQFCKLELPTDEKYYRPLLHIFTTFCTTNFQNWDFWKTQLLNRHPLIHISHIFWERKSFQFLRHNLSVIGKAFLWKLLTFLFFLMIGWGLSSSLENILVVGSKCFPVVLW